MRTEMLGLALISTVVAIDNALLSGMLLPRTSRIHKKQIIGSAGIALAVAQIILAIGVGQFLSNMMFRILAIATVPLFIVIAIFLSEQCERHHWILIVGSGMMAWAAAGLIVGIPGWKLTGSHVALPAPQILAGLLILAIGVMVRMFLIRRRAF